MSKRRHHKESSTLVQSDQQESEKTYRMYWTFKDQISFDDAGAMFLKSSADNGIDLDEMSDLSRPGEYTMFNVVVRGPYSRIYGFLNNFRDNHYASLDLLERI